MKRAVGEGEAGQEQVHIDFVCTKVTLHAKDTEAQGSEGPLPGCVMPMTLPLLAGAGPGDALSRAELWAVDCAPGQGGVLPAA